MSENIKKINKILVANRGEIAIRVLRAASELKIRTIAIFTYEDRYSLHRYKADEAYRIGSRDEPLKPYLDIEELIYIAKREESDAIHPGYGFLSENVNFAQRCKDEGIIFVGPEPEVMQKLGDKVSAKKIAFEANIPVIEDSIENLNSTAVLLSEAQRIGFPVMLKAASGGGGRGMRIVTEISQLEKAFHDAKNEAAKAFGDATIFIEKYIDNPKHIEIQIMADHHGNMVHLYERDCSVQRRFQKVVEVAPSSRLSEETKQKLYNYALKICKHVNYNNVGTVEFLIDKEQNIYFIEVNPRIQVEHTITEEITGIDIVRSQILISQGYALDYNGICIKSQDDIKCHGFAIQCRITTEDPENNFMPDYGTMVAYRNATGFGIRLDEGSAYLGAKISPFFDSMIVKVSAWGNNLRGASERLHRALQEFRVRGVKTNIAFLENVISHPDFIKGETTVKFIESHPELFKMRRRRDRASKLLYYLAEVTVNGNPDIKYIDENKTFLYPKVPDYQSFTAYPEGTKDKLNRLGREKFIDWLKKEKSIQYTDTTFRDAHQSLLATRVRTFDLLRVAESFGKKNPEVFSMEVWGGATFDVCMRFLHESPWHRLQKLRKAIPNILFQMLLRGSNGVGYKAYPDNLIEKFIEQSWKQGIDIFRIFDSLNWVEAMKVSIRTVRERTEALAEAAICYTGEITDPNNKKFTLQYYLDLAKQLEDEGAHILAIKDMAGLLKPYSAEILIKELKKSIAIPIHLHTHDTSSIQSAMYLKAIDAGVDIIDVALGAVSGLTSQPNFNSIVAMMQGQDRENKLNLNNLNLFSNYWEDVRPYYYPFESGLQAGTAEVYNHEIPGGQYSNLRPQARGLGLEDKFQIIKENYAIANKLLGDIVKVTPSSKVVGDLAMFMTSNNLTEEEVLKTAYKLSFPESVKNMLRGDLGQPYGGFPKEFQKLVLKNEQPYTERPNAHLKPIDFEKGYKQFTDKFDVYCDFEDFLSYQLYPKVFEDFYSTFQKYGDVSKLPTRAFFFGMKMGEELLVELSHGKVLIIKLNYITDPDEDGFRQVSFKLNGNTRQINIKDNSIIVDKPTNAKIDESNENEIGSPLQGKLSEIQVNEGDMVQINTPLFIIEAMKMETTITAHKTGIVQKIALKEGVLVEQNDLVLTIK